MVFRSMSCRRALSCSTGSWTRQKILTRFEKHWLFVGRLQTQLAESDFADKNIWVVILFCFSQDKIPFLFAGFTEKQGKIGARPESQVQFSLYWPREVSLHEKILPSGVPRYKALNQVGHTRVHSLRESLIESLKNVLFYFLSRPAKKLSKLVAATELNYF